MFSLQTAIQFSSNLAGF